MKEKRVYQLLQICFVVVAIYITYKYFSLEPSRAILGPVSLLFLLIPTVSEKVLRIRLSYPIKSLIIGFSLIAFSLGTVLLFYNRFAYYDILMHFLSGIVFTLIGLCLYAAFDYNFKDRRTNFLLQISYAFFFAIFIGVLWEIAEFGGFVLFGADTQHHLTTGVFDTMEDLISCFFGGLAVIIDYLFYLKTDRSVFGKLVLGFDELNIKNKTHYH